MLLIGAIWQGRDQWLQRAVHPPDGPIVPLDPVQIDIAAPPSVQQGRWRLSERASYDITARILGREDYHFDALSDLIPEDLALGWGAMSDNRVLARFEISQGARFYSWQARGALPIPRRQVVDQSANTHTIPANEAVRRQLARLRVGEVVHLTGTLVDGKRDDGATIRTSMTRSDEGPGACEVMLVDRSNWWSRTYRCSKPSAVHATALGFVTPAQPDATIAAARRSDSLRIRRWPPDLLSARLALRSFDRARGDRVALAISPRQ